MLGRRLVAAGFDAEQVETHHRSKRDRPSGTAAWLAAVAGPPFLVVVMGLAGPSLLGWQPPDWALVAAMAISFFAIVCLVPQKIIPERRNPLSRFFIWIYRPFIQKVLKYRLVTMLLTVAVLIASIYPASRLGSEFMPPLNEGDLLYMPTTLPGISITKAKELLQQTDKIIQRFPEVHHTLGKIGRAETATDPAPLSMLETTIILKPESEWRPGMTPDDVRAELESVLTAYRASWDEDRGV